MKTRAFVRIPCRSHADAKELTLRLQADDYRAVRRWKAVIPRTEPYEEAERLARGLQDWVGPGTAIVWATAPRSPATNFAARADSIKAS
jgi:hypothetical protein